VAEEIKFPIAQLRAHCQELFDVSQMVFDGALFNGEEEMTKKEAKKCIDTWLKKEVK
jgi:hypothetical protein